MDLFRRNRKNHWERVYQKHPPAKLGWYQAYPEMSLKLILNAGIANDSSIIDVGGGTSMLPKHLFDRGYKGVSILDISGSSIEKAKSQLGEQSQDINWIVADVTQHSFAEQYDLWHDRAVFHFLTRARDREGYINSLRQALRPRGHLVLATFGLDAPPKCSGLPVVRYSQETLRREIGDGFQLAEASGEDHITPSGVKQSFIYCRFTKNV